VFSLIDGEATHNFIDVSWVAKRGVSAEDFEGFTVVMADNHSMRCIQRIPQLHVQLGNYTMIDDFCVVDVLGMNVVLGVQWLYSLGKYSTNYQILEMEF